MGAHVPCESLLELHDMWRAQVQPHIMGYYPQPYTLMFMPDGEKRSYTPDRQDLYSNGAVVVTEIKDDVGGSPDPREAQTLEAVQLLFAARVAGEHNTFANDAEAARAISTSWISIQEVLRNVYGAERLADEITR